MADARRLKALEEENAKLKRLLAQQILDNAMLRDVTARSDAAGREEVGHGPSGRRAWREPAAGFDRSSIRCQSTRPDDAEVRDAMKAVAAERRRFGYRRIHVMLDRQGIAMNLKKLRRL